MGAFITAIGSAIGPAFDGVSKIIDQFHMSPEEKAQAQQAIADAQAKVVLAAQDYNVQLNTIAGQNIRAEETSNDKFTVRARPSVIWVGVFAIFWDYCILPTVAMLAGKTLPPVILPDFVWGVWGTIVTGYVFNRTAEKVAAMPGDSQVSVAGLLKVGQKS